MRARQAVARLMQTPLPERGNLAAPQFPKQCATPGYRAATNETFPDGTAESVGR